LLDTSELVNNDRCSSNKLVCTTSAYHSNETAAATVDDADDEQALICLTIDGVQLDLNLTLFTYTDDPVITHLQPTTSFTTSVHYIQRATSLFDLDFR